MAYSKYKLKTNDEKRGVWFSEVDLVRLISICRVRNRTLYKKLVESYEYLENKKFDAKKGMEIIEE